MIVFWLYVLVGLHDYDKIIVVDYSLEIVIAIINNDYFEQIYAIVWSCMPYLYIYFFAFL